MAMGAWYVRALALCGAIGALVPALAMWGFTVDDALIPLRYAQHLAYGAGYRFNLHGPPTDGVTPLPWALLLVPVVRLAKGDLVSALELVKALGVVATTASGAALGRFVAIRAGDRLAQAAAALVVVAIAYPVGAWAASGMETGIATALATLAVVSFERPYRAAALAGIVATLRPELVVWSLVLGAGAALAKRSSPRALAVISALALGPFVACAVVRLGVFGRPAPLALLAKPSDAAHGLVYAGAASVVVLTPLLALAPRGLLGASALARTLVLAAIAHVVVVVAVGGDWMPYARLMVPIAPGLALVHVELSRTSTRACTLRAVAAIALGIVLAISAAPAGRHVWADRKELIARTRPLLADARTIAALDVGWVGAVSDVHVVDLAGLTDPVIASLPGGHTSKLVDIGMLLDRGVDSVVVYHDPASPMRVVEARITRSPLFAERFVHVADVPLGARGASYAIWRAGP
jgi:hypothetical protein